MQSTDYRTMFLFLLSNLSLVVRGRWQRRELLLGGAYACITLFADRLGKPIGSFGGPAFDAACTKTLHALAERLSRGAAAVGCNQLLAAAGECG